MRFDESKDGERDSVLSLKVGEFSRQNTIHHVWGDHIFRDYMLATNNRRIQQYQHINSRVSSTGSVSPALLLSFPSYFLFSSHCEKMLRALALKPVQQLSRSFVFQKQVVIRSLSSTSAETYTEKQAKLGRPVSPHVTIYRYEHLSTLATVHHHVMEGYHSKDFMPGERDLSYR